MQNSGFFLSIVIPAYNEEFRLNMLFNALEDLLKKDKFRFECIIIDDASTDKTLRLLNSNGIIQQLKSKGDLTVFTKKKNEGKACALKTGVELAKGDYILTMDADVSAHPTEVLIWLEKENYQFQTGCIYIGSREHKNSKIQSGFLRRLVGRIFNFAVRSITKLDFKDTQCGFKLYPSVVGKKLFFDLVNTGWAHDIELLCRAKQNGYIIKEMEITWNSIEGGKISVVRDSVKMLIETIRINKLFKNGPKGTKA